MKKNDCILLVFTFKLTKDT